MAPGGKRYWCSVADEYLRGCAEARSFARASELAERVGLSSVALSRSFKAAVGESISSYLKRCQLERARTLLVSTELSVGDIARCSAYGTARTLYRAFRRATGLTPASYRRLGRGLKEMSLE